MCEQTEIGYLDGEIVWVKLGSCWWPGEVVGSEKLPPDLLPSFRKPPIAVVKFFQEDTYEYVKNLNSIYKYNCSRKNEFINKGLYMYRTKRGHMEKFPEDVIRAETAVGGDITILTRDEFQEMKKESYAGLFGDPRKIIGSNKKGKSRSSESSKLTSPIRKIKEKTNYKVHILLQGSKTPNQFMEHISTPSTSRAGSEPSENIEKTPDNKTNEIENQIQESPTCPSTPTMSSTGQYACHACQFTTTRLNVLILHNKTHSITYMPYTPSPIKKKIVHKTPKSTPVSSKPKQKKSRQEKSEKTNKKSQILKRPADPEPVPEVKKPKTDEEIKSSLLADWDDGDEESNDESSAMVSAKSPEVPVAAASPAVPIPAEVPSVVISEETQLLDEKKSDDSSITEKPESSNDSKYEFCEDEDWPLEADIGRKIPRVKNPSKRKSETKSISVEDDEMAREVADLLTKTTVPDLPTAPEPLKVEENFPKPSIVKSPDKPLEKTEIQISPEKKNLNDTKLPPKTIFKTKTFFRSRHSRSQDAIGKYVAEQLNAAERLDLAETELNGADLSSPREIMRISPPKEHVKIARLAPKIQLKKMKAEAAQLRERENADKCKDDYTLDIYNTKLGKSFANVADPIEEKENSISPSTNEITPDILSINNHEINNQDNGKPDFIKLGRSEIDVIPNNKHVDTEIQHNNNESLNQNTEVARKLETEDNTLVTTCKLNDLPKSYEPFMNESTASAVDALLSVSRETDRVTKVISDDPPEDLFEEDIKDNSNVNDKNIETNDVENPNPNSLSVDIECNKVRPDESDNIPITDEDNNSSLNILEDNNDVTKTTNVQEESVIKTNTEDVASPKIMFSSNDNVKSDAVSGDRNTPYSLENPPSESDLQIAEALINLPSTTMQNKATIKLQENNNLVSKQELSAHINESSFQDISKQNIIEDIRSPNTIPLHADIQIAKNDDNVNSRFEMEREQSENLNAAKSLVQMSESIDHKMKVAGIDQSNKKEVMSILKGKEVEGKTSTEQKSKISSESDHKIIISTNDCVNNPCHAEINRKSKEFDSNSSKLLKILEEPCIPKATTTKKTITKQVIVPGKEKILNFEVEKPSFKHKSQSPKQKIIIRRTAPNKTILNNISEVTTPDKIILSRSNRPAQDGSPVQTYTIQTAEEPPPPSDGKTIIIQQKIRKITKPMSKLQKIRPPLQTSPVTSATENTTAQDNRNKEDAMFDINSMPVVLSEDILTPENIEKMPIVMSDGNVITNSNNPPKLIKTKSNLLETEKSAVSLVTNKNEIKTLLMNSTNEVSKVTTPNILSKSSKLRSAKPMLVIDKVTGKQKIVMTKSEPTVKEIKPPQTIQSSPQNTNKTEKFIILPTPSSPRSGKTQKIVIDPQTGKAHVLVGKGTEAPLNVADNKPVSAKLIPSASDTTTPGNTVMIITNAQGAQSRIVLTPEHEKILFPNKQTNLSQLKTVTHRITSPTSPVQKTISTTANPIKNQTRIVPKQKSAIITSKGQLIVGSRITTATQNIAPLPEIRPAPKRILASEPKKLVQTIQKNSSEPLIFLQQKSGAVMQLTAAQFEHLRRTGQIIQKGPQEKIVVQKSITLSPNETVVVPTVSKQRIKKQVNHSPPPSKKVKHEIAIAPAPTSITSIPALSPLSNTISSLVQNMPSAHNSATATNYSDLDNIEELLPSTAIARQDSRSLQPELATVQTPPASLSDGQLLAVPGEHFGGPSGSFYLCVEENGRFTVIDNRPLVLENNQLVPMAEPLPVLAQPERRDILEAALANSDVFHAETVRDDAPDFRDLNANVSVHCRVSETSSTLNQPIMTPVEVPSKGDSEPNVPSNLEDGLAVIGVTPLTVPTSLELPITVTDPRIAPKTTDPLSNNNYGSALLPSPNTEMTFSTTEQTEVSVVGPISMPLLTEEESVGKSMPILTDELTERTTSSVESTIGSPSSIDVRESENEDSSQWPRRLLTPCSDISETSAEIPLQPVMQLSVNDMSHNS